MDWRIYYSDGSTFSSDDGPWEHAPAWDVQVILFRHPESGWAMRHNGDYFRMARDGTIVAMDTIGMIDHVSNVSGVVKVGRMLTQEGFDKVYQQAKQDMAGLD